MRARRRFGAAIVFNQCASIGFTMMLGRLPLTLVVPVVNSLTFLTTYLAGAWLGTEHCTLSPTLLVGMLCIVIGVGICMHSE
jgi:hypothetical protein